MGLDVVELMLEIEEEFGVSIADDDAVCFSGTLGMLWIPTAGSSFRTLGQLARILAARNDDSFRMDPEPSTVDDPVWDRLCSVIVREFGVDRGQLDRHTRMIEDLGF